MNPDQIEEESENSFLAYAESLSPLTELTEYFKARGAELKAIDCQAGDEHLSDQLKTDDADLRAALGWKQRHTVQKFQDLLHGYPIETDEDYRFLGEIFDEDN